MHDRIEIINSFYGAVSDEDSRLSRSRHGQLEYLTTMHYIHREAPDAKDVLELGAGSGRYSAALAREDRRVTALELAEKNFEQLEQKSRELENLTAVRGDALDLSRFPNDAFDLTLILGPLYHLYDKEDQLTALREAIRVTRPGGVLITAFLSVHAILFDNYLRGNWFAGEEENFAEDYRVRHFPEQLFTGFNIDEFEALFDGLPVMRLVTAATDGVLELAEGRTDFALSDAEFEAFARYHLHHCERRELLGASSHLIHICKKLG